MIETFLETSIPKSYLKLGHIICFFFVRTVTSSSVVHEEL